jgi:hypothetical protein
MAKKINEWNDPEDFGLDNKMEPQITIEGLSKDYSAVVTHIGTIRPDGTINSLRILITVRPTLRNMLKGWLFLLGWPLFWVLIAQFLFHW